MNIKKGDSVKIIAGKDRGKTGKILNVLTKEGRVSVEGINVYKKHVRPRKQGEKGEIVSLVRPLQVSNVQIICPSCSKSVRVGFRVNGAIKTRFCKKCKANI